MIAEPFFGRYQEGDDPDIPGWAGAAESLRLPDGANTLFPRLPLSTATPDQIKWHAKLLAEAIPPLSGPAGWNPVGALQTAKPSRAFDLMAKPYRNTALWPKVRPGKEDRQQKDQRWLHGDYKDAPFVLTLGLYRKLVEISE